ncbi:SIMPL domain-containing protein [bacterium]|nr:SIMPL domain-containing protein [bacterium]
MKNNTITRLFLCFLAISLSVPRLFAQDMGNAGLSQNRKYTLKERPVEASLNNDKTMTFHVRGLINAKADGYLAIFNMVQLGETPAEANQLITERFDTFLKGALAAGIKRENIKIDMISQIPIYEVEVIKKPFSKKYNEVPKGIEIQKNIHVLLNEGSQLDKVVAAAAEGEIYDLVKVEYFVKDSHVYYEKLREACIASMNKKLADFEKLGISLDSAHKVLAENSEVIYPFDRYQRYQAFSAVTLEAKKKKTGINKVRKPETRFYNKVNYAPYDVVLNAIILEPAVQFTYSIVIRYTIDGPVPQVKVQVKREKEFLLLTPEGKLQVLKVE